MMSVKAKLYIYANVALGAAVLANSLAFSWQSPDPLRYLCYLLLTIIASTLKVRLPGMNGTMSLNFLFVLMAVADLGFSEAVLFAACGALVQSLWRRKTRPNVVQVAFNTAVLTSSAGLAYVAARILLPETARYLPMVLCLGATLYFFSNTFLVSGVISLVERRRLYEVWCRCHLWTFPYYLAGAAMAGMLSVCNHSAGWRLTLLLAPASFLFYLFYKQCVSRLARQA
jgi:hypothetical protein